MDHTTRRLPRVSWGQLKSVSLLYSANIALWIKLSSAKLRTSRSEYCDSGLNEVKIPDARIKNQRFLIHEILLHFTNLDLIFFLFIFRISNFLHQRFINQHQFLFSEFSFFYSLNLMLHCGLHMTDILLQRGYFFTILRHSYLGQFSLLCRLTHLGYQSRILDEYLYIYIW